jgi:hypothetical protein
MPGCRRTTSMSGKPTTFWRVERLTAPFCPMRQRTPRSSLFTRKLKRSNPVSMMVPSCSNHPAPSR